MINPILNKVSEIALNIKVPTPYLVGGFPRDQVLGRANKVADFDITNGDNSIHMLAGAVAAILKINDPNLVFEYMQDNHAKITSNQVILDFSSHFISPQSFDYVKVEDGMLLELISRDFSCNTLLMKMDGSGIEDRLGTAMADIKAKIIKTNMAPSITLVNDPKRVVRAIYLAAKIGFEIDESIVSFVRSNPDIIRNVNKKFINDKIRQAISFDSEKTNRYISQMGLSI
jgi:tRNA nucleotidyltransferase/poly(A) polymerase